MRRKEFLCKMTAALLSAAMVVTWTPVNGQTRVDAAGVELAQDEFPFGSAGTRFAAGEYSLPVALMKSADITSASMAGSCIKDGKMTVNQDGTADITIGLQAVTMMSVSEWASGWNIYTGDLSSDKKPAEYTENSEGKVDSITFRLPENTMDGVYVEMFISAMNSNQQGYLAFDFAKAAGVSGGNTAEKKTGTAKVQQFGSYDVNVAVSVLEGKITGVEVEGANFDGSYADYNKVKLQSAADVLKAAYIGKSAADAKEIEGVDAVSGATYSSEAIQTAVLNALGLEAAGEMINLPTQKLAEGAYQVDIAFYTDGVKHSLVGDDKAKATITVDANGNMTLTTAVVSGTDKEPLYFYDFNGYYEGNNVNGTLKTTDAVKKEDVDFTDDVFRADEKVVTEVSFPLEGGFAETYAANASIYVPAMKNLTGEMGGITFHQGRFSSDCYAKIYWDSLKNTGSVSDGAVFGSQGRTLEAGDYTFSVSMKNAADITKDSMAGKCIQGAVLTVNLDGSAKVALELTGITVMDQTAWASDWKIFQEQNTTSDTVDAEVTKTDADGNVTQIVFDIPDNREDGVYISMVSGGSHVNQAYLAFDFANATKQKVNLEDGVYVVEGTMYKPDFVTKSMADTAFNHNIQMTVKDGKATLTMNFKGMEITGQQGYLGSLKYYDTGYQKDAANNPAGTLKDVTVESVQKYSDGVTISDDFGTNYPDVISFEVIPEALEDGIVPLQVFVPIMESITAGTGNQNVYLKLDLGNLKKTTAEDELLKDTDAAPENPAGTSSQQPSGSTTQKVKVGQKVKVSGHTYKVTAKGKVAFTACKKNAKTVAIPATIKVNGVTCKVTKIAKNAFKNNTKLTKVTVGKNVSKVGSNAFKGCKKLKTVKLSSSLTKKKKAALKKLIVKAGVSAKLIK